MIVSIALKYITIFDFVTIWHGHKIYQITLQVASELIVYIRGRRSHYTEDFTFHLQEKIQ